MAYSFVFSRVCFEEFHKIQLVIYFLLWLVLLFKKLLEREREGVGEGQRERGDVKQAARSARSLMQGLIPQPWDHDLSRNQGSDTQMSEPLRHP